jgi:uncharacterized protein with NAD-binding domain and iron-sulfur cluster
MARTKPTTVTKVSIVGGGIGGLAAAFELSNPRRDPKTRTETYLEHTDTYEITVYQMGWRLGGKAASGRNVEKAGRIEEHGLHVWMGFYENAFRMLRKCYDELKDRSENPKKYPGQKWEPPKPYFRDWTKAFFPDAHVGVADKRGEGEWESWTAWFPPTPGMPGDPLDDEHENPFTLVSYLLRAVVLLRTLMLSVLIAPGDNEPEEGNGPKESKGTKESKRTKESKGPKEGKRSTLDSVLDQGRIEFSRLAPRLIVDMMTKMLRVGTLSSAAGLLQAVLIVETLLKRRNSIPGNDYKVLEFLDAVASNTRRQLEDLVKIDPRLRRKTEMIDLVMTCIVGVLNDNLLSKPNGLDAIDHLDAREWLEKHGATYTSLQSPIMRGLYDMAFADVEVDGKKRGLSAGQALRCTLRMFFTYRGSLFWRMQSSMGDVVLTPLYHVLKARGVKFNFFHRLESIKINYDDPDAKQDGYVEELEFDVQAETENGQEYSPLINVKGMQAWPSRPNYSQLKHGTDPENQKVDFESFWDRRRVGGPVKKRVNEDFHFVVLAVGLGTVRYVAGDLLKDPRWKDMVDNVKTVATQAFQIWLRKDMAELGWREPPVTLSAIEKPFDTWSDMTHVILTENWPPEDEKRPRTLAYFCGALPELKTFAQAPRSWTDGKGPGQEEERLRRKWESRIKRLVKEKAIRFLSKDIGYLWPGATRMVKKGQSDFKWALLVDSQNPDVESGDRQAFESQFWTASLHPSDRYVLSVPGSAAYRISPLDDTYANLSVAGDWTACGFIGGCVEAAVMSGRLAAHAISGEPGLHAIIGYDHP